MSHTPDPVSQEILSAQPSKHLQNLTRSCHPHCSHPRLRWCHPYLGPLLVPLPLPLLPAHYAPPDHESVLNPAPGMILLRKDHFTSLKTLPSSPPHPARPKPSTACRVNTDATSRPLCHLIPATWATLLSAANHLPASGPCTRSSFCLRSPSLRFHVSWDGNVICGAHCRMKMWGSSPKEQEKKVSLNALLNVVLSGAQGCWL